MTDKERFLAVESYLVGCRNLFQIMSRTQGAAPVAIQTFTKAVVDCETAIEVVRHLGIRSGEQLADPDEPTPGPRVM